MRLLYGYTLKNESFRRLIRTFQPMIDNDHRLAWYIANDFYDKLKSGKLDTAGAKLAKGPEFNALRVWWMMLIEEKYPDIRPRFKVAFDLVNKALSMLKGGSLTYVRK